MKQQYFIVVLAHSLHGRLRRIHIPYHVVYAVLALALLGGFTLTGVLFSYLRMALKVANYNALRQEVDNLRTRYQRLEKAANQTNEQLATFQLFASEVSLSLGIVRKLEGPASIASEGRLIPTVRESIEEYDFLKGARMAGFYRRPTTFQLNTRPMLWPVTGSLLSYFGARTDPFSGEGRFHTGVDISAPAGTPVKAAADGVVVQASYVSGGYGKLIVVRHSSGLETYYAHLSKFNVMPGQEVRMGEIIASSGGTGRVTTPHLHYEVRVHGAPMNPHQFLTRAGAAQITKLDIPF